jgi:Glycosyltransferase 61
MSSILSKIKNKVSTLLSYIYVRYNKRRFTSSKIYFYWLMNRFNRHKYNRSCIKDNENILDTPAALVLENWGGRTPSYYNFDPSIVESSSTSIRFFEGSPIFESKTFYDVIYIPQFRCLYLSDGSLIDYSCRPCFNLPPKEVPHKITPPKNLKKVNQTFIYGGHFIHNHYGHFLTECLSRLWYAVKDEEHPILCSEEQRFSINKSFVDIFMNSINIDKERFISLRKPICFREITIPYPSFMFRREGFSVHKLLPESVAQTILPTKLNKTMQPLYISRAKFISNNSSRSIENEKILEEKLRDKNFAIAYPEQLSLEEQIYLINKHEVIVGVCGSALHNILFDISNKINLICFADKDRIHPNFLLIDAIKQSNSIYISTLKRDNNEGKPEYRQNRVIDLNSAISGLKESGLFS